MEEKYFCVSLSSKTEQQMEKKKQKAVLASQPTYTVKGEKIHLRQGWRKRGGRVLQYLHGASSAASLVFWS